jgi:hypothetical protein
VRKLRLPYGLKLAILGFLVGIIILAQPGPVYSATPIILDSLFLDWVGEPCIADPAGDAYNSTSDLINFCFTTNPNDPTAYFMAERPGGSQYFRFRLLIDTDNDGVYNESSDRYLSVDYDPHGNRSDVWVNLYSGSGQFLMNVADNVDWGESNPEGGGRVEWGVGFSALGIVPGQPIRIVLETYHGQTLSDSSVEVQWSPADALGWLLLGVLIAGGAAWFSLLQKRGESQTC